MDENVLLDKVKSMLGITISDPDMDNNIKLNISAVKGFLINAGASLNVGENDVEISCIAIGVNDIMNQTAGEAKYSPAFNLMANQICRG